MDPNVKSCPTLAYQLFAYRHEAQRRRKNFLELCRIKIQITDIHIFRCAPRLLLQCTPEPEESKSLFQQLKYKDDLLQQLQQMAIQQENWSRVKVAEAELHLKQHKEQRRQEEKRQQQLQEEREANRSETEKLSRTQEYCGNYPEGDKNPCGNSEDERADFFQEQQQLLEKEGATKSDKQRLEKKREYCRKYREEDEICCANDEDERAIRRKDEKERRREKRIEGSMNRREPMQ